MWLPSVFRVPVLMESVFTFMDMSMISRLTFVRMGVSMFMGMLVSVDVGVLMGMNEFSVRVFVCVSMRM